MTYILIIISCLIIGFIGGIITGAHYVIKATDPIFEEHLKCLKKKADDLVRATREGKYTLYHDEEGLKLKNEHNGDIITITKDKDTKIN